jgi:cysteine desulfurase
VQAVGRITVDCAALGVDFLTVSAHKLGGPKGAGALVIVDGAPLPALIPGGQERGRRAGTENIASIAGFGAAAQFAMQDLAAINDIGALRDVLEAGIVELTPEAVIIGCNAARLANTSCVALPGFAAETSVIRLDLAGVSISAGSACSSGKVGQSAALLAQGLAPELARSAIRISLGHGSTHDDVAAFLAAWKQLAKHHAAAISRAA